MGRRHKKNNHLLFEVISEVIIATVSIPRVVITTGLCDCFGIDLASLQSLEHIGLDTAWKNRFEM